MTEFNDIAELYVSIVLKIQFSCVFTSRCEAVGSILMQFWNQEIGLCYLNIASNSGGQFRSDII